MNMTSSSRSTPCTCEYWLTSINPSLYFHLPALEVQDINKESKTKKN